jgi:hypothetical protein
VKCEDRLPYYQENSCSLPNCNPQPNDRHFGLGLRQAAGVIFVVGKAVPTFSNPRGPLATTRTPGTRPKTLFGGFWEGQAPCGNMVLARAIRAHASTMPIPCQPRANPMPTPYSMPMSTPRQPHADSMRPHANYMRCHVAQCQCQPHAACTAPCPCGMRHHANPDPMRPPHAPGFFVFRRGPSSWVNGGDLARPLALVGGHRGIPNCTALA